MLIKCELFVLHFWRPFHKANVALGSRKDNLDVIPRGLVTVEVLGNVTVESIDQSRQNVGQLIQKLQSQGQVRCVKRDPDLCAHHAQ